jgi:hypothetical protein
MTGAHLPLASFGRSRKFEAYCRSSHPRKSLPCEAPALRTHPVAVHGITQVESAYPPPGPNRPPAYHVGPTCAKQNDAAATNVATARWHMAGNLPSFLLVVL